MYLFNLGVILFRQVELDIVIAFSLFGHLRGVVLTPLLFVSFGWNYSVLLYGQLNIQEKLGSN